LLGTISSTESGDYNATKYLLDHHADPNLKLDVGHWLHDATPIVWATVMEESHITSDYYGNSIAKLLIDYGANPCIATKEGVTAPELAISYQQKRSLASFLLTYGRDKYDATSEQINDVTARTAITTIKTLNDCSNISNPWLFNDIAYFACNKDVAGAFSRGQIKSGFEHFTQWGIKEARPINLLFNEEFYLNHNSDVAMAVINGVCSSGIDHFLRYGAHEGRMASDWFNEAEYLKRYPDIKQAVNSGKVASGIEHFVRYGMHEGRDPCGDFDEAYYRARHHDIDNAVNQGLIASGFEHYMLYGIGENREYTADFI
jgi:hypothetical protein